MRKIGLFIALVIAAQITFAQAVKDRNVIPVAVNLNQVLRMTIKDGGNIEFVFNDIAQYKNGLSGDAATSVSANPAGTNAFYKTNFVVSSSTRWKLTYGAEEATFIGTDDPANTLTLDNVGFTIVNNGTHAFGTENVSVPTNDAAEVAALQAYPTDLIADGDNAAANAGDETDNDFTLVWRCGTAEAGPTTPMNTVKLIDQQPSPIPDRYVVNVLFELSLDN